MTRQSWEDVRTSGAELGLSLQYWMEVVFSTEAAAVCHGSTASSACSGHSHPPHLTAWVTRFPLLLSCVRMLRVESSNCLM